MFSILQVDFSLFSPISYPGLPGWPFLGQISEIWIRFKLVGLNTFIWIFGLFDLTSSMFTLKIRLAFWLFFDLFTLENFPWWKT